MSASALSCRGLVLTGTSKAGPSRGSHFLRVGRGQGTCVVSCWVEYRGRFVQSLQVSAAATTCGGPRGFFSRSFSTLGDTKNDGGDAAAAAATAQENNPYPPNGNAAAAPPTSTPSPAPSTQKTLFAAIVDGTWPGFLSKAACTAPHTAKLSERWLVVPASFLVQGSVGSVYAWSLWNTPLTKSLGVVASSLHDWDLGQAVMTFTTMACSLGVTTFLLGPWSERAGPRYTATVAAAAYTASLLTCGAAVWAHSLPLLYCGGVLGGVGWGFGYISPVSTLLKWFPDRRGLAGGLALSAFGAGAAIAAPLIRTGVDFFAKPPVKVPAGAVIRTDVKTGAQFYGEHEVVYATKQDIASFLSGTSSEKLLHTVEAVSSTGQSTSTDHLLLQQGSEVLVNEGFYLVNSGDTGVAQTFLCLAAVYGSVMLAGASCLKTPPANWAATAVSAQYERLGSSGNYNGNDQKVRLKLQEQREQGVVTAQEAIHTPQFAYLWMVICGNACGGMALLSTASTVMTESFGALLPAVVTTSFAASYVSALSLSNSAGRLGWSVFSDWKGRRTTYYLFAQAGVIGALSLPRLTDATIHGQSGGLAPFATVFDFAPEAGPLMVYCGITCLLMSFYGGQFSVLPGYIADLFSEKHAGAIHGRILTAWSAASILGPNGLTYLRDNSYQRACKELAALIPPEKFEANFGVQPSSDKSAALQTLLDAKTATIPRLLELCPEGTPDPSLSLYSESFFIAIGAAFAVAGFFNGCIRKVDARHFSSDGSGTLSRGSAGSSHHAAPLGTGGGSSEPGGRDQVKNNTTTSSMGAMLRNGGSRPGGGISI